MLVDIDSVDRDILKRYQLNERVTNEEFKIWKKTVPLLYDTIQTHVLPSPLLTVQWLPELVAGPAGLVTAKVLFGTNTSGFQQDHVHLGEVLLPATLRRGDTPEAAVPIPALPEQQAVYNKPLAVTRLWAHAGEVNRMRVSPDGARFATMGNAGTAFVYDVATTLEPVALAFHSKEGYAVAWQGTGGLVTGAGDHQVAEWLLVRPDQPVSVGKHTASVNDVAVSTVHSFLVGSVLDDHLYQLYDLRAGLGEPFVATAALAQDANAIAFHPQIDTLFATGHGDTLVALWDLRKPNTPFRRLYGSGGAVQEVQFLPVDPLVLVLAASDKRVHVWSLDQLEEEFDEDGYFSRNDKHPYYDPCLVFVHGGHTYRVNDVAVHPHLHNVVALVGDDLLLEVWRPHWREAAEEEEEEAEAE